MITEYEFCKQGKCKTNEKVYTKNISSIYLFDIVLADESFYIKDSSAFLDIGKNIIFQT